MLDNVEGFCEELKVLFETHHFASSAVMNFEEPRLVVKGTGASLFTFGTDNGSVFLIVNVLKD